MIVGLDQLVCHVLLGIYHEPVIFREAALQASGQAFQDRDVGNISGPCRDKDDQIIFPYHVATRHGVAPIHEGLKRAISYLFLFGDKLPRVGMP